MLALLPLGLLSFVLPGVTTGDWEEEEEEEGAAVGTCLSEKREKTRNE